MKKLVVTSLIWMALAGDLTLAAQWERFQNSAYGYSVEVPTDFQMEDPGEDGWTFVDAAGARVLVFGADLPVTTFEGEASNKIVHAMDMGWVMTQSAVTQWEARFQAERAERVLQVRGIWLCNGAAAFVNFEYDRARAKNYSALVEHLMGSLQQKEDCQKP